MPKPLPLHLATSLEQVAQHSSGDSMGFRGTNPVQVPTLPLPKSGAWVNYVADLHVGKLRLREVKSLTSVTQQGWSQYLNLGNLTPPSYSPYGINGSPTYLGPL